MDSIVECQSYFILILSLVLLHPPPLPPVPHGGMLIHGDLISLLKLNRLPVQVNICYIVAELTLSIKSGSL